MSTLSRGPIKFIKLTQGQYAIVDEKDFERVSKHKWYAQRSNCGFYAGTNIRVAPGRIKAFKTVKMSRFIVGAKEGEIVDHIDHDTLDNSNDNLRICRQIDNSRNMLKRPSNKSGFKGVNFHKASGQWIAQIGATKDGKRKNLYLGIFRDKEEAAKAYDKAAKEIHGEFASLNLP